MSMSHKAVLLIALLGALSAAFAQEQATTTCLIEGTALVEGKQVHSKDCFENVGAEPDDFKRVCDAMEQTAIAVTKSIDVPPPKISHGKNCPAGAVARCRGFLHMPILNYHYPRSAHELEIARESCLTQGGEWK